MTSGSQRSSQEQFGRTAARYTTSKTHSGNDSLVDLQEFVAAYGTRFRTAVDIGTGPGFTAFAIAPYADRVVATDVTPQMLEQVRGLREQRGAPQTQMALVAAEALPFANDSIDLITCRTAAHHFVDLLGWLAEVERVLSPGGLFLIADTCAPEDPAIAEWMHYVEVTRDASHVRNLSPSEWREAVAATGLTVTDSAMSYVYLEYPDWAERAGMTPEAMESIKSDMLGAAPSAKQAFGIEARGDGIIDFHWDVVVVSAVKDRR
jgi:ubiquinone/menaquinone biosynthesis C-methylase UbiE